MQFKNGEERINALNGATVMRVELNKLYFDNGMYLKLDDGEIDVYNSDVTDISRKSKQYLRDRLLDKSIDYFFHKKDVSCFDIEKELTILGFVGKTSVIKNSGIDKLRLCSWGHRVRDFNPYNFELKIDKDKVELRTLYDGSPRNWQTIIGSFDIIINRKKRIIYIDVHGEVLNGNGKESIKWIEK